MESVSWWALWRREVENTPFFASSSFLFFFYWISVWQRVICKSSKDWIFCAGGCIKAESPWCNAAFSLPPSSMSRSSWRRNLQFKTHTIPEHFASTGNRRWGLVHYSVEWRWTWPTLRNVIRSCSLSCNVLTQLPAWPGGWHTLAFRLAGEMNRRLYSYDQWGRAAISMEYAFNHSYEHHLRNRFRRVQMVISEFR